MTTAVVVFTRDLRVRDQPALAAAARADRVVPLFVIDDGLVRGTHAGANRLRFLLESLTDLDGSLRRRGGALVVRRGRWADEVARIVADCGAELVHVSADVSGAATARVAELRSIGARAGFTVTTHPGITVHPPGALLTGPGTGYQVFTPFYRRWIAQRWRDPVGTPDHIHLPPAIETGSVPTLAALTRSPPSTDVISGGEHAGLERLRTWAATGLVGYAEGHDAIPADATSRISAYLHLGCLSPLEVAVRLRDRPGGAAFVRQLGWRDFFHQLLAGRPELAREDLRARGTPTGAEDEAFVAWCEGRTGYPLVDAGMRQLRREGFMHNRVRMVAASFLTKDLDVRWQAGAAHFMSLLVDGDLANNQLNWQWVAGTGTDGNPHRVFNPTRQSERFDPAGSYIRRYVAELADLDAPMIHDPSATDRADRGYPDRLVDHGDAVGQYRNRVGSATARAAAAGTRVG